MKNSEPTVNPADRWNQTPWQEKERFLLQQGFKTGWSSHTWKYLCERIQARWIKLTAAAPARPWYSPRQ